MFRAKFVPPIIKAKSSLVLEVSPVHLLKCPYFQGALSSSVD